MEIEVYDRLVVLRKEIAKHDKLIDEATKPTASVSVSGRLLAPEPEIQEAVLALVTSMREAKKQALINEFEKL